MKKYFLLITIVMLLAACAPSPQAIQTSVAETQAAWTPTPSSTYTPTPTTTHTPTPTTTHTPTITIPVATATATIFHPVVWVVDEFDMKYDAFNDTLTVLDEKGNILMTLSGLNLSRTFAGHRQIASSLSGDYVLIADLGGSFGGDRLVRYNISGEMEWAIEGYEFHAVDISANGYAYALVGHNVYRGGGLVKIDPSTGAVVQSFFQTGYDLVIDDSHSAIWLVSADIKKFNMDGQLQFTIDPIKWTALSVDFTSDGSVWVSEATHPDVSGSQTRIFKVSPTGEVSHSIDFINAGLCVRVDRNDDSVWVTTFSGLFKFDTDGNLIKKFDIGSTFTIEVDQHDSSIWVTSYYYVLHLSSEGIEISRTGGFSLSQVFIAIP